VAEGRRISGLDRLRKSPTDVSGTGVGKALEQHVELRGLGASAWDLSAVPAGKVAALARFAKAARAKAVADLAGDRKLATLVAFAAVMEPVSADEAIEVFDLAMGDLLRTSAFKAGKERLRTLKDLDAAAIVLREVWLAIRDVAAGPVSAHARDVMWTVAARAAVTVRKCQSCSYSMGIPLTSGSEIDVPARSTVTLAPVPGSASVMSSLVPVSTSPSRCPAFNS
jgi:hypothetical protein